MKVYVAGSSREMARARSAMERLRALDIEVTSTWIESIERAGDANPRQALKDDRRAWSRECLDGVAAADVLWLLAPALGAPTCGAWVELGYAVATDKTVIASGDVMASIFTAVSLVEYSDDDDALAMIVRMATMGAA